MPILGDLEGLLHQGDQVTSETCREKGLVPGEAGSQEAALWCLLFYYISNSLMERTFSQRLSERNLGKDYEPQFMDGKAEAITV